MISLQWFCLPDILNHLAVDQSDKMLMVDLFETLQGSNFAQER